MKSSELLSILKQCHSNEPEFIQAVEEFWEDIAAVYDQSTVYQHLNLFDRLTNPDRVIQFRINWEDDQGNVQVNRGWRVQFNNALGPYKGGIRFHPSVNLSVLKFLGFEQIFKNALTGLPMGGGKGGSDFDPKGKSDAEIRRFCYAFMRELAPYIGADIDVPAGDIGVGGREINYMFAMYKTLNREFTGVLTGKTVGQGGSLIRTEATGFGLVYFLQNMLEAHHDSLMAKTVLVSGAGNVSLHAAQKCIELGAQVLTLSDSKGTLYLKQGFSLEQIEALKNYKAQDKRLKDFVGTSDDAEWIDVAVHGISKPILPYLAPPKTKSTGTMRKIWSIMALNTWQKVPTCPVMPMPSPSSKVMASSMRREKPRMPVGSRYQVLRCHKTRYVNTQPLRCLMSN